jgi:hypothetical protein
LNLPKRNVASEWLTDKSLSEVLHKAAIAYLFQRFVEDKYFEN